MLLNMLMKAWKPTSERSEQHLDAVVSYHFWAVSCLEPRFCCLLAFRHLKGPPLDFAAEYFPLGCLRISTSFLFSFGYIWSSSLLQKTTNDIKQEENVLQQELNRFWKETIENNFVFNEKKTLRSQFSNILEENQQYQRTFRLASIILLDI